MVRKNRKTTLATSRFQAHDTRSSHSLGKATARPSRPATPLTWHPSLDADFSSISVELEALQEAQTEDEQLKCLRELKGRVKNKQRRTLDVEEIHGLLLFMVNSLLDPRHQHLHNAIVGIVNGLERELQTNLDDDDGGDTAHDAAARLYHDKLWQVVSAYAKRSAETSSQSDIAYTMYALLKTSHGFRIFIRRSNVLATLTTIEHELTRLAAPLESAGVAETLGRPAGLVESMRACKYLLDFLERYIDAQEVRTEVQGMLCNSEDGRVQVVNALMKILHLWMSQEEKVVPKETMCCCANLLVVLHVLRSDARKVPLSKDNVESLISLVESEASQLHLLRAVVNFYPRKPLFETSPLSGQTLIRQLLEMLLKQSTNRQPSVRQVCYFALQSWFSAVDSALNISPSDVDLSREKWVADAVDSASEEILTLACLCSKREHHVLMQVLECVLRIGKRLPGKAAIQTFLDKVLDMVRKDHASGRIGARRAAFPAIKLLLKMQLVQVSEMLQRQPCLLDMLLDTIAKENNLSNTAALVFKQILISMMKNEDSCGPNLWLSPVVHALTSTTHLGRTRIADTLLCPLLQQVPDASTLLLSEMDDSIPAMRWTKLKLLTSMRRSGAALKLSKLRDGACSRVVVNGEGKAKSGGNVAKKMQIWADPEWLYDCFLHGEFPVSVEALSLITLSRKESQLPSAEQLRLCKRMIKEWFKLAIPAQRNLVRASVRRLISWIYISTRAARNSASKESVEWSEALGIVTWLQQVCCHQIYPGAPFDRIHLALELLWDIVTTFNSKENAGEASLFLAPLVAQPDLPHALVQAFLQSFDRGRILAYDILTAIPTFPFSHAAFVRQALQLASGTRARECDAGATMLRLLRAKGLGLAPDPDPTLQTPLHGADLRLIQELVDLVNVSRQFGNEDNMSAIQRLARVAQSGRGVVGVLMALGYVWKDVGLEADPTLAQAVSLTQWRALATDMIESVLAVCDESMGLLAEEAEGEVSVDCRGHVFAGDEADWAWGDSANVGMMCWLTVREGCALLATLVAYSPLTGENWVVSHAQVERITQWLLDCLLHLKHKGALEHATNAFQTCCHTLLRIRSLHQSSPLGLLPSKSLHSLLHTLRTGTITHIHILRRSAGFAASFLAIARAELADGRADLLHATTKTLLELCSAESSAEPETRVHCMNILCILAGDASLKYDLEPLFGTALQAALRGMSAPQWALRNASMNAYARIFQRLVGQNSSISAPAFLNSFPVLVGDLLSQVTSSAPYPALLLLSRLGFAPADPRPVAVREHIDALRKVLAHPQARIRALAAQTLVNFTEEQARPELAASLARRLGEVGREVELNEVDGSCRCLLLLTPLRLEEEIAGRLVNRLVAVEKETREKWGEAARFLCDAIWAVLEEMQEVGQLRDGNETVLAAASAGCKVAVRVALRRDSATATELLKSPHSAVREEVMRWLAEAGSQEKEDMVGLGLEGDKGLEAIEASSKEDDESVRKCTSSLQAAVELDWKTFGPLLEETPARPTFLPERLARWNLLRKVIAYSSKAPSSLPAVANPAALFESIADVASTTESYSLLATGISVLAELADANVARFAEILRDGSASSNISDVRMACAQALQRSQLLGVAHGKSLADGWKAAFTLLQDEDYAVREVTNKVVTAAIGLEGDVTFEPYLLQKAARELVNAGGVKDEDWGKPSLLSALELNNLESRDALFEPDEENMYDEPLLRYELFAQLCIKKARVEVADIWREELVNGLREMRSSTPEVLASVTFRPEVFEEIHKCMLRAICPGTRLSDELRGEARSTLAACPVMHPVVRANLRHLADMDHAMTATDLTQLCFLAHVRQG